jgi:putative SOS response-associated peptidase YedK
MCGRFTRNYTWAQIHAMYSLIPGGPVSNLQPRYNICPTTEVDVVVRGDNQRRQLIPMRWGLIPGWWKKSLKEVPATFNARAETIATKPMFREAFERRRCLMPASGYFEWQAIGKEKQPWYFTRTDRDPITIAGLHEAWNNPETGERMWTCSMVITEPNKFVAEVHSRMPVILDPSDFEQWERGDVNDAAALMKPADDDLLQKWPVSKRVNSSRADENDTTLIEKIATVGSSELPLE